MTIKLKYLVEAICSALYKCLFVFPINKKKIVFSSFSGRQYSDSPKRISDYLLRAHPDYVQIWAFTNPESFTGNIDKRIKVVKFKSLKFLFHVATCNVYVDNVEYWSILRFRKKQMVIQTWHGGGLYKRVGSDRLDVSSAELRHVENKMKRNTLFLSSCHQFTEKVIRGAFKYEGKVLEVGLPRNDELIKEQDVSELINFRKKIGIDSNSKILLYAPTFRNSLSTNLYDVQFDRVADALNSKFGGEWVILLRLHYYLTKNHLAISESQIQRVVDVTNYPDMQELLRIADVLITDYSSCMWDFSLMKKPVFIYANDIDEYCTERNFYLPIQKWPFLVSTCNDELIDSIKCFDCCQYLRQVEQHHKLLGSTETGKATENVCEAIEKHMRGEI